MSDPIIEHVSIEVEQHFDGSKESFSPKAADMYTRGSQLRLPDYKRAAFTIVREGEDICKKLKLSEQEKKEFDALSSIQGLQPPEQDEGVSSHLISTPSFRVVDHPSTFPDLCSWFQAYGDNSSGSTGSEHSSPEKTSRESGDAMHMQYVADCTGCGKTHRYRSKRHLQHTSNGTYCGQYKLNVRSAVESKTFSHD